MDATLRAAPMKYWRKESYRRINFSKDICFAYRPSCTIVMMVFTKRIDDITNQNFIYGSDVFILQRNITEFKTGNAMYNATFQPAPVHTLRQQFANLRRALGEFSSALYAAQARELPVAEAANLVTPVAVPARAAELARKQLFSLARQHEQHSPSLSAELRNLASRG